MMTEASQWEIRKNAYIMDKTFEKGITVLIRYEDEGKVYIVAEKDIEAFMRIMDEMPEEFKK